MARPGRLRKGRQFDSVYSEGTVIGGPLFVLRARPGGGDSARWGFAVGRRLDKRAVVRNRLRRRLREAVRALQDVPAGYDIVVTARPALLGASFGAICAALAGALGRIERTGGEGRR